MQDHLKELLGILYTPGAAEAVAQYSSLFRRPVSLPLSTTAVKIIADLEIGCFIVSPACEIGKNEDTYS